MCSEPLHIHALSVRCLPSLANSPVILQRCGNRGNSKVGDGESRRATSVQHDATTAVMVLMRTVGAPVAAAGRMSDDKHASSHRSSESSMDGIEAAVGGGERHPPAMRRGEASEGADGGAAGWD